MKKIFATFLTALLAVSIWAVDLPKQGFGLQIGWAQPILRLNDPSAIYAKDSLINTTHLNGLKVGVTYDASYVAGFGSSMGINYTFGAKKTDWKKKSYDLSHSARSTTTYHQIELFVDWQYKFEVAKETYLILYSGPTLQYGFAFNVHTWEREDFYEQITKDETVNRYNIDDADKQLSHLNVTWGVGAGFQYQRYFLRGGYDFGILTPYQSAKFADSDRYTRGRFDQWNIRLGIYLWYEK